MHFTLPGSPSEGLQSHATGVGRRMSPDLNSPVISEGSGFFLRMWSEKEGSRRGAPAMQRLSQCQCPGVGAAAAAGPQLRLPQGPRRLCPFWAVSLAGVALVFWGPDPIE